jgi:hypothetical protein
VESQAKDAIIQSLSSLDSHPAWVKSGLSDPEPLVESGCPQPAMFSSLTESGGPLGAKPLDVAEPSYYKVHVYVLPDDQSERLTAFRLTAEEDICVGDNCVQVTTGLYLLSSELADSAFVLDNLSKAIGLEPAW